MNQLDLSDHQAGLLVVQEIRAKCDEAAFSFYAAHVWNKLPENLRIDSYLTFYNLNKRQSFAFM